MPPGSAVPFSRDGPRLLIGADADKALYILEDGNADYDYGDAADDIALKVRAQDSVGSYSSFTSDSGFGSGVVMMGDHVLVGADGDGQESTPAGSGGVFSFVPSESLTATLTQGDMADFTDGQVTIAVDGRVGSSTLRKTHTFAFTAPNYYVDLKASSDSGVLNDDNITGNTTPVMVVSGFPGDVPITITAAPGISA